MKTAKDRKDYKKYIQRVIDYRDEQDPPLSFRKIAKLEGKTVSTIHELYERHKSGRSVEARQTS